MEFLGPNPESIYFSKFIRIEEKVYVTGPNNLSTQHYDLAKEDGIINSLISLTRSNPQMVDCGILMVNNMSHTIEIFANSATLRLPKDSVKDEARKATGESIKAIASDYQVEARLGL